MWARASALVVVLSFGGCGPIAPASGLDAGEADARADSTPDARADSSGEPGSDSGATCGNGILDPGESCDVGVASGEDACPRASDCTAPACGRPRLEGTRCAARCVVEPIVDRIAGDGCCPDGAGHFARHELGSEGIVEGTLDATPDVVGGGHTARLIATFHGTFD